MSSVLEQLASTLGFTAQELMLNRAGQISTRQFWECMRWAAWGAGTIIVIVAIALFTVLVQKPTGLLRIVYCVLLLPGAVVVSYFCSYWIRGAIERKVVIAEGSLSFRGAGRGPPTMLIDKARVTSPPHARAVLKEKERYRLFYLAYSDVFLSIEPLPEAEEHKP